MGNRYGPRADEFAWTVGVRRRLVRYIQAGLTHAEAAMLLGTSRGSVSAQVAKEGMRIPEQQRHEWRQRQSWERATHGRRGGGSSWEYKLVESWEDRKKRRAREALTKTPAPNP